jgi:hypothetical protein
MGGYDRVVRSLLPVLLTLCACAAAPPPLPQLPPPPPPAPAAAPVASDEAPTRRRSRYTLERDPLPGAFRRLPPRDREQWHACRAFFLQRRPRVCREGDDPARCGPRDTSVHLEFTLHVEDYLREPDAPARRALLIDRGCPEGIVDLADGSHLDMVEDPKDP